MSINSRRLANGKTVYDVRLRTPEGLAYKRTFRTRREAEQFDAADRVARATGAWINPAAGRVPLADYAARWLQQRIALRPRTRELYENQLRRHILPGLGQRSLNDITTATVRHWYAELLHDKGLGPVTVAKCYRLLRTILGTAVEDGLVAKNPCVIKNAGVEHSPERPVATVAQIYDLAEAVGSRHRALVLTAAFTGLRLGELLGLSRRHVDLEAATVTVVHQRQQLNNGTQMLTEPKTAAGRRTVTLPELIAEELAAHLERYTPQDADAFVFVGERGGPLRRHVWQKAWDEARQSLGLGHLHFHDLRHTGNTLAAATGASTKELMARLGHSSPQAALRYQHASRERDLAIATALNDLITGVTGERHRTAEADVGCAMDVP